METPTVKYFGKETVEKAVASYFAKHGTNEKVIGELMMIATHKPADFLEIVCGFVERETV